MYLLLIFFFLNLDLDSFSKYSQTYFYFLYQNHSGLDLYSFSKIIKMCFYFSYRITCINHDFMVKLKSQYLIINIII